MTSETFFNRYNFFFNRKVPTTRREFRKDVVYWTFCVPSACTNEDVEFFFNTLAETYKIRGLLLKFEIPPDMCQVKKELQFDGYDVALW